MTSASVELARIYVQPEFRLNYFEQALKLSVSICKTVWEMPKGALICPEAFAARLDKAVVTLDQLFESDQEKAIAHCKLFFALLPTSCESIEVGTKTIHTCKLNPSYQSISNFMDYLFDKFDQLKVAPYRLNKAIELDEKAASIQKFDQYISLFLQRDYSNPKNSKNEL